MTGARDISDWILIDSTEDVICRRTPERDHPEFDQDRQWSYL